MRARFAPGVIVTIRNLLMTLGGNASEQSRSTIDRPFGVVLDIELDLPPPPSVNQTRRGHGKGTAILNRWHKLADQFVTAAWAGGRRPTQIPRQFEAVIILDEKSNAIDLDNGIKALIDYAKRLGLITDDSKKYMRELRVVWGTAPHGCRLILRAREPNA